MVNLIVGILLAITFFFFGQITQALKKLVSLFTGLLCKFLNLIGIKIKKREPQVKVSEEFKKTYKGIKKVKLSRKNIKQSSSIDWVSLSILGVALILFFFNLGSITGNAISNWLFKLIEKTGFVKTAIDMNTLYTATIFSVMSFAAGKILNRWKQTKQQRIEARQSKIKIEALSHMTSKELVEEAKKKDEEKYKELK